MNIKYELGKTIKRILEISRKIIKRILLIYDVFKE